MDKKDTKRRGPSEVGLQVDWQRKVWAGRRILPSNFFILAMPWDPCIKVSPWLWLAIYERQILVAYME